MDVVRSVWHMGCQDQPLHCLCMFTVHDGPRMHLHGIGIRRYRHVSARVRNSDNVSVPLLDSIDACWEKLYRSIDDWNICIKLDRGFVIRNVFCTDHHVAALVCLRVGILAIAATVQSARTVDDCNVRSVVIVTEQSATSGIPIADNV